MSCGVVEGWLGCVMFWDVGKGRVTYSLVCDDGFAVAAFDGEGFFARVGVWCL